MPIGFACDAGEVGYHAGTQSATFNMGRAGELEFSPKY